MRSAGPTRHEDNPIKTGGWDPPYVDSRSPSPVIAVNIPCMIASGVGGHPDTATSTGMMLPTRPHDA